MTPVDCLAAPMYGYYFHMGVPMELHPANHQADHEEKSVVDWGSLTEEIMEHIFARMPIKQAVRASCVCRHWQSIVDSRSFVTFILQFRIQKRWFLVACCSLQVHNTRKEFLGAHSCPLFDCYLCDTSASLVRYLGDTYAGLLLRWTTRLRRKSALVPSLDNLFRLPISKSVVKFVDIDDSPYTS